LVARCPTSDWVQTVRLTSNNTSGLLRQRLIDLGFTVGTDLRLVRRGPKNNLIAVSIRGTIIALRSDEARDIWVIG
jgi:ferrous iron transport protein A